MPYQNPPADELAIRDLVARYADAVNRNDKDAWGATWSEQGYWNLLGLENRGRTNIVQFWLAAMSGFKFAIHMNGSGTLSIDGNQASGRWYLTEYTCDLAGATGTVLGVYDDKYAKQDGNWLFTERRYHILYQGPADLSGNYQPYPA